MKKTFAKILPGLLAVTLLAFASQTSGQTTNKTPREAKRPAEKTAAQEKKASAGPFHGNLAALDKNAKTITVGKRTFQITSETKIHKAGNPATIEDGVVGEPVSGYVKPDTDGKLIATTVNFGPKTAKAVKGTEKKKNS